MIKGFSKLSKEEKQKLIIENYLTKEQAEVFNTVNLSNNSLEQLIESFSENVISVFPFPFSVAPNFLINGKDFTIPFVTEESSVVAAAAKAANFWYSRGGFHTEITGTIKTGHIHFKSTAGSVLLQSKITLWTNKLLSSVEEVDRKMASRGGGIQHLKLINRTEALDNYYQIELGFNTCNAMGANYINTCLEGVGNALTKLVESDIEMQKSSFEIIMAILSNYSPNNAVKVWVECNADELDDGKSGIPSEQFALKFTEAVKIAEIDTSRAVTHNKGLFNGIDSVVLATGNDWRAIEANGHAYAARNGQYSSLSKARVENNKFRFEATIPMQVGTVGGITTIHPGAKLAGNILNQPTAEELMQIIAVAGLASNFSAVKALVTTGIQKGHMKMHLSNILAALNASEKEKELAIAYFSDKTTSNSEVEKYINSIRQL